MTTFDSDFTRTIYCITRIGDYLRSITTDEVLFQTEKTVNGIVVRIQIDGLGDGGFRVSWREAHSFNDAKFHHVVKQRLSSALMVMCKGKYLNL